MIFQDSELNKLSRLFNQIINETYGLERESLDALSFIPPQAGIGQWLRTWTYKVLSEMGVAKLISDYAEDLPPVSRALELKTNDIREYGVSYGYSEFELMQWLTAGIDLSRDEAETARRKIDEKVDEVLFVGDKDANTTGFLNNANVPMVIVPTGASGGTSIKGKTLLEIIATFQAMIDTVRNNTRRTIKADTVLLPHDAFVYLSTTPKDEKGGDLTVLEYLKKVFANQGLVNWKECAKLDEAGEGGSRYLQVQPQRTHALHSHPVQAGRTAEMLAALQGSLLRENRRCRVQEYQRRRIRRRPVRIHPSPNGSITLQRP